MKFVIGEPNNSFVPSTDEWKIKEYGMIKYQLVALPIVLFLAIVIDSVYYLLNINISYTFISILFIALIVVPIHELSHALVFPKSIVSSDISFGFYPKAFVFFTHYDGVLTRKRLLLILITPFIIITVVPIIFFIITGIKNDLLAKIAFLNALSSSLDILMVFKILKEVPSKAYIRNNGFKSYWKERV